MSKQTDNDPEMFNIKVELRERLIKANDSYKILEAFSGDGRLWRTIKNKYPLKKINVLRIDTKAGKKGTYLKGDNVKFMRSMDLTRFDIIDLDAYGSPFNQLEVIFNSKYSGPIICTFIQIMTGGINKELLLKLGYSLTMQKKCPSLFSTNGMDKMKAYLSLRGVTRITYYCHNRKNYFSFIIPSKIVDNSAKKSA